MMRLLAFLAMSFVWGFTWIASKWAMEAAPPVFVAGVRLVTAGALFGIWAVASGRSLRVYSTGRLVASALMINTFCYSLLFWGVARIPSGLAAILNLGLLPVFTMGIGAIVGQERITARRIAAICLGMAGLLLLFSSRTGDGGGEAALLGELAIVVATVFYAGGAIASKPLVRETSPVSLAFWQTLIGGLALIVLSVLVEGWDPSRFAALARGRALAGIAFLVLGGSLVGFSTYLWLLREWGAFRAGLYAFVTPVVAVAIGVFYAGEAFGWPEALGMAVMLGAAALAIRKPEPVTASGATGSSPAPRAGAAAVRARPG